MTTRMDDVEFLLRESSVESVEKYGNILIASRSHSEETDVPLDMNNHHSGVLSDRGHMNEHDHDHQHQNQLDDEEEEDEEEDESLPRPLLSNRPILYTIESGGRSLCLEYALKRAQIPCEIRRIRQSDWPAFKSRAPLQTSPFMELNNRLVPETAVILMWIASVGGMMPNNPEDLALARSLHGEVMEVFDAAVRIVYLRRNELSPDQMQDELARHVTPKLAAVEVRLAAVYPSRSRPRHCLPCGVTFADCSIAAVYRSLVADEKSPLHLPNVNRHTFRRCRRIYDRLEHHPVIANFNDYTDRYCTLEEAENLPLVGAESPQCAPETSPTSGLHPMDSFSEETQEVLIVYIPEQDSEEDSPSPSLEMSLYEVIARASGYRVEFKFSTGQTKQAKCWIEHEGRVLNTVEEVVFSIQREAVTHSEVIRLLSRIIDLLVSFRYLGNTAEDIETLRREVVRVLDRCEDELSRHSPSINPSSLCVPELPYITYKLASRMMDHDGEFITLSTYPHLTMLADKLGETLLSKRFNDLINQDGRLVF